MYEFAWPMLLALLILPLIWWILPVGKTAADSAALKSGLFDYWRPFTQSGKKKSAQWSQWLFKYLLWALLVVALARPQWVGEPIELPASGRDLMVSIDISGSMETPDLKLNGKEVTRLAIVKHLLADFIQQRQGDRIGLVLFGEKAYLQTPLTFDLKTISHMLMETEIGLAGSSSTAIGDGIGLAVKRLKERPAENRVLILLTDGQNKSGALTPIEAAKLAEHAGITIYTIGVGADEMIIQDRLFNTQRRVNPSEELDETTLKAIAEMTNGRYFRARDEQEFRQIYAELDKLEPIEKESEIFRPTKELFFWPLSIALGLYFLLVVATWLRHTIAQQGAKQWR
ncbi:MAG: VWA domain-containing protein [Gammaproteobacteria bacterium]|nr:VWA domain-containing protein [Gammaproteobacteria bacterium]